MGSISSALAAAAMDFGTELRTGISVETICVDDRGDVKGVKTADGEFIQCRAVVSNATPFVTVNEVTACCFDSVPTEEQACVTYSFE